MAGLRALFRMRDSSLSALLSSSNMDQASEESSQDLLKCGETASIFFQKANFGLDVARYEEFWKRLKPASYAATLITKLISMLTGEDKHVQLYDRVKALVSNNLGPVPDIPRPDGDITSILACPILCRSSLVPFLYSSCPSLLTSPFHGDWIPYKSAIECFLHTQTHSSFPLTLDLSCALFRSATAAKRTCDHVFRRHLLPLPHDERQPEGFCRPARKHPFQA